MYKLVTARFLESIEIGTLVISANVTVIHAYAVVKINPKSTNIVRLCDGGRVTVRINKYSGGAYTRDFNAADFSCKRQILVDLRNILVNQKDDRGVYNPFVVLANIEIEKVENDIDKLWRDPQGGVTSREIFQILEYGHGFYTSLAKRILDAEAEAKKKK